MYFYTGKLLGVKKWAIILFIFGFLVVLSQYSTESSNQIINKYKLFKFNNNKGIQLIVFTKYFFYCT